MLAFKVNKNSVNHVVNTASTRVELDPEPRAGLNHSIRIHNIGTNIVYVSLGNSGVNTSLATGMSLAPNAIETFAVYDGQTHLAAIASGAGNTLNITLGHGM
jgi:hypothetical protein